MEIREKLIKFKFQLLIALILSAVLFLMAFVAPKFVTVLAYFWPLLLSTALFLLLVVVFGSTSFPGSDGPCDKAGEGLLDYVAGQPELPLESFNSD